MSEELELYIHIPFCLKKCAYCDFLSGPADEHARQRYVDALVREIREEIATEISAGGVHHPDALLQADSGRGTVSGGRLCRRIRKLQEEGQKVSLSGDNAGYTVISINLPSGSAMQLS